MKRKRLLLPGAFSQLNRSEMHCEEEDRDRLLAEHRHCLLALGVGLFLAAVLVVGLYSARRPLLLREQVVAQTR